MNRFLAVFSGLILLTACTPSLLRAIEEDIVIDPANVEEQNSGSGISDNLENGTSLGVLAAYLGLFSGAGYFIWRYFKKSSLSPQRARGSNGIHLTDTKALGNRQYLVVVECDGQRMLVGVGQGFINHLCFLDETRNIAEEDVVPLPEAELKEALRRQ